MKVLTLAFLFQFVVYNNVHDEGLQIILEPLLYPPPLIFYQK